MMKSLKFFTTEAQRHRGFRTSASAISFLSLCLCASVVNLFAQEPTPGPPKSGVIPVVGEKKLANGLTVAVGERHSIPLVTVQLLIKSGAGDENLEQAGLANLTASMLTKGTKTRTATQIAEQIEFLGGSINTGAGWNSSFVTVTVSSDKLDQALAIMADVVLNPTFKQDELDLLKNQALDGLTYNLKQPGFLANYVASRYSFGEHPAGGMPESVQRISRKDIQEFHKEGYVSNEAVLVFAGDIAITRANQLAARHFGRWRRGRREIIELLASPSSPPERILKGSALQLDVNRIMVVDLPNSGQAAVKYLKRLDVGRIDCTQPTCSVSERFFPATVLNSVLGGGYSSRLNQEIRIKRGLSYGAGSSFAWRDSESNFSTSTQTKSESAAEVAKLVLDEIDKLGDKLATNVEIDPRKLVLSGDFGRDLETTAGLADRIADLYAFGLKPVEMNSYVRNVRAVTDQQIRSFADSSLRGGDIIIVGDAKLFMEDLKKRFPGMTVNVIPADELDLGKESLRK